MISRPNSIPMKLTPAIMLIGWVANEFVPTVRSVTMLSANRQAFSVVVGHHVHFGNRPARINRLGVVQYPTLIKGNNVMAMGLVLFGIAK